MERVTFEFSTKSIPIANKKEYKKLLVQKTDKFFRNLRWRVWHFKNKSTAKDKETYGFKSRASPPQDVDLIPFESDLLLMIRSIQFRQVENEFQKELQEKIRDINKDQKVYVPADKTRNFYKIKDCTYKTALMENITKVYKKMTGALLTR